jgi:hypothetical protein
VSSTLADVDVTRLAAATLAPADDGRRAEVDARRPVHGHRAVPSPALGRAVVEEADDGLGAVGDDGEIVGPDLDH